MKNVLNSSNQPIVCPFFFNPTSLYGIALCTCYSQTPIYSKTETQQMIKVDMGILNNNTKNNKEKYIW